MRRSATPCIVLGILMCAGVARAQVPDSSSTTTPPREYQSTVHARPKRDDGTPQIVLTARDLKERGAQSLADALELIPEVQVRQGGMGTRLDVRGAKQFSILVLIDGVPVDEPYFGIFDVGAIPITDIVEIRVQLSPASPLEGPGGDGGIVEVTTLRAIGSRMVDGRVVGSSTPGGEAAVTGRSPLPHGFGIRASASARFDDPTYPVVASDNTQPGKFNDRESQATAGLRLEYEKGSGRFTADAWYGHRSFFIPPSDNTGNALQDITSEDAARLVVGGEFQSRGFRVALGAYGELLSRDTDYYTDYTLKTLTSHQQLLSWRIGEALHVDRPLVFGELHVTFSARLSVDSEGVEIRQTGTLGRWEFPSYGELALGGKLRYRWLTAEAAVGGLVPFSHPEGAWPEAKVVVGGQPNKVLGIYLIGARKGRLPTLRELYDPSCNTVRPGLTAGGVCANTVGNPNLTPEQTWHGELQLQVHPHPLFAARLSGYVRRIDGLIRLGGTGPTSGQNQNLDTINVRGFETGFDLARDRILGAGITYIYEDAYSASPTLLFNAIPNFPNHRIDAYVSSTWRRRLGGVLRFRWVSERLVQQTMLPRYDVFDLYAWARISDTIRAAVHVDNLFDQKYLLLPGLTALPTTVTATVEGVWR
jgi:outer membrane receptor protein involved in Fe transport